MDSPSSSSRKRRRSLSPHQPALQPLQQQQPPQQQELLHESRRQVLLNEAASHGPYLWSNADVKNALLWFRNDKKEEDKQQKRLLLQRLLHSRGILEYRPLKTKKNKNRSRRLGKNKKQTKTTNHVMDSEQQLRNAWKERMEMEQRTAPPLRSLLDPVVYHDSSKQCDPASTTTTSITTKAKDDVRQDLVTSICVARATTSDMYHTCSKMHHLFCVTKTTRIPTPTSDTPLDLNSPVANCVTKNDHETSMSRAAGAAMKSATLCDERDAYFLHPDTVVQVAYAHQLVQRLESLFRLGGGGDTRNDDLAAQQFVQKLSALAQENTKIRTVQLLMLLQTATKMDDRSSSSSSYYHSNITSLWMTKDTTNDTSAGVPRQDNDDKESNRTVVWCDMCVLQSHAFLESMMPITHTNHSPRNDVDKDEDEEGRRFITSLPSPLICCASHIWLPLAQAYVRRLLRRAIHAYMDQPRRFASNVWTALVLHPSSNKCSTNNNEEEKEEEEKVGSGPFDFWIKRIRDLTWTSERLSTLAHDMLQESSSWYCESSSSPTIDVYDKPVNDTDVDPHYNHHHKKSSSSHPSLQSRDAICAIQKALRN